MPFEATFYVKVKSEKTVELLINVNPNFLLSGLYSYNVCLADFKEFIESLYLGKAGFKLVQHGTIVERSLEVSGKYAFNSISKIGKVPVGFASLTTTVDGCKKLYEEYCGT